MKEDLKPFSPDGQKVLDRARAEATRFNHNFVGTEHMLLGIVLTECRAQAVLTRMSVNLGTIQTDIEHQIGTGPDGPQIRPDEIPFTPRVRKCFRFAHKDADRWSHTEIESDHILCALLLEGDGVASRVLRNHEIDLETLRQHVLKSRDPAFNQEQKGPGDEEQTVPSAAQLIGSEGLTKQTLDQWVSVLNLDPDGSDARFSEMTRALQLTTLQIIAELPSHIILTVQAKKALTAAIIDLTKKAGWAEQINSSLPALRRIVATDGNLLGILGLEFQATIEDYRLAMTDTLPPVVHNLGCLLQLANADQPVAVSLDFVSYREKSTT